MPSSTAPAGVGAHACGRQPGVRDGRVGVIAVDQALHLFILAMLALLLA
jgi:hypothetical protein